MVQNANRISYLFDSPTSHWAIKNDQPLCLVWRSISRSQMFYKYLTFHIPTKIKINTLHHSFLSKTRFETTSIQVINYNRLEGKVIISERYSICDVMKENDLTLLFFKKCNNFLSISWWFMTQTKWIMCLTNQHHTEHICRWIIFASLRLDGVEVPQYLWIYIISFPQKSKSIQTL